MTSAVAMVIPILSSALRGLVRGFREPAICGKAFANFVLFSETALSKLTGFFMANHILVYILPVRRPVCKDDKCRRKNPKVILIRLTMPAGDSL